MLKTVKASFVSVISLTATLFARLFEKLKPHMPASFLTELGFSNASQRRAARRRIESESKREISDAFRFAPELFECRAEVIAKLSEHGFDWLSHYSSIDPNHDCYGIEVCGIHDFDDATDIQKILMSMFPNWRPG